MSDDYMFDYPFAIKREEDLVTKDGELIKAFTFSRPAAKHEQFSESDRANPKVTSAQIINLNSHNQDDFVNSVHAAFLYIVGSHVHAFSDMIVQYCEELKENQEINLNAKVMSNSLHDITPQENTASAQTSQER